MAELKDCPFCSPKEHILRENKNAQVILSNPHKVPGHFLVVPKRHIEKPWELTQKELHDVFELIFFVEQRIIGMLGDGCDIRQNYRPFAQSKLKVDHVHFHVIPRSHEDYLYKIAEQYESDLFVELDDMEREAVVNILK